MGVPPGPKQKTLRPRPRYRERLFLALVVLIEAAWLAGIIALIYWLST